MEVVKDKYLKRSIEDVNNEFIIDPTKDALFNNPVLPLSKKSILQSWEYFYFEQEDDDVFAEKFTISFKDYNAKTDEKFFDFATLDSLLDPTNLRIDLSANVIKLEEDFKAYLERQLLHLSTELQIERCIQRFVHSINESLIFLESTKFNKVQGIVKDVFIVSYIRTLGDLRSKYAKYWPRAESRKYSNADKSLEEFIFPDDVKTFKDMEMKLISLSWIEGYDEQMCWKKKKNLLIDFCRLLQKKKVLRLNKKPQDLARFLQARYKINIGDQIKPSKYNKRFLDESKFYFLDL